MNNGQSLPRTMTVAKHFFVSWRKPANNPLWYVVTITGLAWLTIYLRFLWWLAGAVALVWGLWLVWQIFRPAKAGVIHEELDFLDQALIYQIQINQIIQAGSREASYAHRQQLVSQINRWVEAIRGLVQGISNLRQNHLIQFDLENVPAAIESLEVQLASQTNPDLRRQLDRVLTNRQNQLASLQLLQNTGAQAEIQLENTLALLGTVYSQILTSRSTNHVADYDRLVTDVDEAASQLQDQVEALREVRSAARNMHHVF